MVAQPFIACRRSWLGYLAASLVVNAMAMVAIGNGITEPTMALRVNLASVAAPTMQMTVTELVKKPPATPKKAVPPVTEKPEKPPQKPIVEKKMTPKPAVRSQRVAKANPPKTTAMKKTAGGVGRAESTVISEARYRRRTPPIYPPRALELGQQGTVTLHARITADGMPSELEVAQSSGYPLLDMAAQSAVREWLFEPAAVGDRLVASWVRVPIRFVIRD